MNLLLLNFPPSFPHGYLYPEYLSFLIHWTTLPFIWKGHFQVILSRKLSWSRLSLFSSPSVLLCSVRRDGARWLAHLLKMPLNCQLDQKGVKAKQTNKSPMLRQSIHKPDTRSLRQEHHYFVHISFHYESDYIESICKSGTHHHRHHYPNIMLSNVGYLVQPFFLYICLNSVVL